MGGWVYTGEVLFIDRKVTSRILLSDPVTETGTWSFFDLPEILLTWALEPE